MTHPAPTAEEAALDARALITTAKTEIAAFVKIVDVVFSLDKTIAATARKRIENDDIAAHLKRTESPEDPQALKQISALLIKASMYPFTEQNLQDQKLMACKAYADYAKVTASCLPLLEWVAGSLRGQLEAALNVYIGGKYLRSRKAASQSDLDSLVGSVAEDVCRHTDVGLFLFEQHANRPYSTPDNTGAAQAVIGWGNRCVKLAELWQQFLKDGKRSELPL